ncbi:hypothetical protein WV31_15040 [Magnetospirillum sp. ME-1]|uniref:tetratricopeptide repeat protein n=1 Tax=Magnetospirillum sp. ME-1 TaxID=1639348 RepID=UPI000A17A244|nr:hypothetical protein [Magnetospirillum sp. ME-1]ARJ66893.1 hypothetical protein WV31_15040 [Magnetospirillum sp. ME-1]
MRLLAVALLLCLSMPAWAAGPSLSAQDEARLIYLEKRVGELDAQNRELRAHADKAADGPKAELAAQIQGAKDVAAAQVQGAKESLTGQLQGLSSNFNMLLGFGGVAITLLLAIFALGAWDAGRKARSVADEKMRSMEGELKAKVTVLTQGLEAKELEILEAVQRKADGLIGDMEVAKQKGYALAKDMEAAKQQGDAHVEALAKNRTRSDEITAELVNLRSPPASTPEGERLEAETRNTPPQDLTEDQLTGLTKQALAKGKPADVARYAGALAGKKREDPYALILLSRSRQEQGLLEEAIDVAQRAIEVAQSRKELRTLGAAYGNLGDALLAASQLEDAKTAFIQFRDIFAGLVAADASNDEFRRDLGGAWGGLGDVAMEVGNLEEAKAAFTQSRDIFAGLVAKDANDGEGLCELGAVWSRLCDVAMKEGRFSEAKAMLTQSRGIVVGLAARDASNTNWQYYLGAVLGLTANVALTMGETDEAVSALRQAEMIIDTLLIKEPEKPAYRQGKARLISLWGDYHAAKEELDAAQRCWSEAVSGFEALEQAKTLNFLGRRALREYRTKLKGSRKT